MTKRGNHRPRDMTLPSTHGFDPIITQIGGTSIGYVDASVALKNSDIYSVINRISSDIAAAKYITENTYVARRLNQPSQLIGRFSFWQGVIVQLLLSGNAYVPLDQPSLQQVPPSSIVSIDTAINSQKAFYTVAEYNGVPGRVLSQDNILHFRLMPDASYQYLVGMSPLESLVKELTVSKVSADQSLNLIQNRITPTAVLKINNALLEPKDRDVAREEFNKANSGTSNGQLMVLDENSTFSQFEMKADVFKALNDNAAYSADQITKAFGVPIDVLGGGNLTESQHSNITQTKSQYYDNLISYVAPMVSEESLKMNAADLDLDFQYVDSATHINQINSMVKSGSITQAQAEMLLMKYKILPAEFFDAGQKKGEDDT